MVAYVGARPEAPAHNLQSAIISTNVFHAFPLRVACLHLGLDPFAMGYGGRLFFGFLRTLHKQVQARTNVISGSDMFIQYELRRFGIDTNTDRFPVDINGEFKPKSIMLFIQERKTVDLGAADTASDQVTVPREFYNPRGKPIQRIQQLPPRIPSTQITSRRRKH